MNLDLYILWGEAAHFKIQAPALLVLPFRTKHVSSEKSIFYLSQHCRDDITIVRRD